MKTIGCSLLCLAISVSGLSQGISVTFSGTGAATTIDSVNATNLRTNECVTLPGNETLLLSLNTGIQDPTELTNQGILFPNPFSGQATLRTMFQNPQKVQMKLQNLVGQVVAQTEAWVQPGENEFSVSVSKAGIYLVTLQSEQGITSFRAVCYQTTGAGNQIGYLGSSQNNNTLTFKPGLKTAQTTFTLGYTPGDVILYRCRSGIYTTIKTDSPAASKKYEVEFVPCTDPDGRNYSIVKIDEQTWMAENLCYLPSVSSSSSGTRTSPIYYVYGYEGSDILGAKGGVNYKTYGVLYNWEAAMSACPTGWRLPSDDDWKILERRLGMSESDANDLGTRYSGDVGTKLKSTSGWLLNQNGDNSSGFSAIPGGRRNDPNGGFDQGRHIAFFWSSSASAAESAWGRFLGVDYGGIDRSGGHRAYGYSVRCLKDN